MGRKRRREEEDESTDDHKRRAVSGALVPKKEKSRSFPRVMLLGSRGMSYICRHLLDDLCQLMPHSKRENKLDTKSQLVLLNELCDISNCGACIFLEVRKRQDVYLWISRSPDGPSVKFFVTNIHTMTELRLTGNCIKGSRPIIHIDDKLHSSTQWKIVGELLMQIFGTAKGHPKSKPFVDHVLSFFLEDDRIWFRSYQIVPSSSDSGSKKGAPELVEIGPRFVLQPVKILDGSFCGRTLWENPNFVSPSTIRSTLLKQRAGKYHQRILRRKKKEIVLKEENDGSDDAF